MERIQRRVGISAVGRGCNASGDVQPETRGEVEHVLLELLDSIPPAFPNDQKKCPALNVTLIKSWMDKEGWRNDTLAEKSQNQCANRFLDA